MRCPRCGGFTFTDSQYDALDVACTSCGWRRHYSARGRDPDRKRPDMLAAVLEEMGSPSEVALVALADAIRQRHGEFWSRDKLEEELRARGWTLYRRTTTVQVGEHTYRFSGAVHARLVPEGTGAPAPPTPGGA